MRTIFTFTAATLLMASAFGAGEVYRWKGSDGTWHYSDQPRAGAELVRSGQPAAPPMREAEPAANPDQPAPAADEVAGSIDNTLPVSDAVAEEVRSAAAAAKSDQCSKAEDAYQRALVARVFTRTDAQGKVAYLNNAEIDAARLQARANRDLACGPGA
jgi:hypothetical protein